MFGKFLRDESASTAIEYSLIAGFIALARDDRPKARPTVRESHPCADALRHD